MKSDEDQIRELVARWMQATKEGDTATVLSLMADDAIFLVAGRPPSGKEVFEAAANNPQAAVMKIDGNSDILELTIAGDWAFAVSYLSVEMQSEGSPPMSRAGNTLTVFTKRGGRWLLYRDANLLVPVTSSR